MQETKPDLDTTLPFRVGYPRLKTLPLRTMKGKLLPRNHLDTVKHILEHCNVRTLAIDFVYRVHNHVCEDEKLTIFITSDITVKGQREAWIKAATKIFNALVGFPHTMEIIDKQAKLFLFTRPILTGEIRILQAWSEHRAHVVDIIRPHGWESVDLVYRGILQSDMKPTVTITTTESSDRVWYQQVIPEISKLFNHRIDVEIVHGRIVFSGESSDELDDVHSDVTSEEQSGYDSEGAEQGQQDKGKQATKEEESDEEKAKDGEHIPLYVSKEDFKSVLTTGASVGVKSGKSSGTLGAYMKLDNGVDTLELALTNYHVIFPDSPTDTEVITVQEAEAWPEPVVTISPSESDARLLRHSIRKDIRKLRGDIHDRTLVQRAEFDEKSRGRLEGFRKKRDDFREDLQLITTFDKAIGSVYAASGWRYKHVKPLSSLTGFKFAIDWALVLLSEGRSMTAQVPSTPSHLNISSESEINHWQKIVPETSYRIAKVGRTSGWTRGTINAAQSCIIIQNKTSTLDRVFRNDVRGKESLAFSLVGHDNGNMVINCGDSGSLILLDAKGEGVTATAVGLGFCGNPNNGVTYMSSLEMILDDIEEVTGGTVKFPTLSGDAVGMPIDL